MNLKLLTLLIITLTAVVSANISWVSAAGTGANVAYVYKTLPDASVTGVLNELGYNYDSYADAVLISPLTDLSKYKVILIQGNIFNKDKIPFSSVNSIFISDSSGDVAEYVWTGASVSKSSVSGVLISKFDQLGTDFTKGFSDLSFTAYNTFSNNYNYLRVKPSYVKGIAFKSDMTSAIVAYSNQNNLKKIFFGLSDVNDWSEDTKLLFKNSMDWLIYSYCSTESDCKSTQICNNGLCVDINCKSDSGCNDNNAHTFDKCNNPGTLSSSCTHEAIACLSDSECGANAFTGNTFCKDNNGIYQNFITYTCNNPGQASSSCSNATAPQLKKSCIAGCLDDNTCLPECSNDGNCNDNNAHTFDKCNNPGTQQSQCMHTPIACLSDDECGANIFTGDVFCQNNNLFQNFMTYTCNNPGTISSSCSNATSAKQKQACEFGCTNNACKANQPPVFNAFNCTTDILEDTSYTCQLTGSDAENEALSFSVVSQNNMKCSINGSVLTYVSNTNYAGNASCVLRISDNGGNTDASFNVDIDNVNDAPVITDYSPKNLIRIIANTIQKFYVIDSDPDSITTVFWYLNNESVGTGSSYNFSKDVGDYNLTAVVKDGQYETSQSWNVPVRSINEFTCSEAKGYTCAVNEICGGSILNVKDTTKCCNIACSEKPPQFSDAGKCTQKDSDIEITINKPASSGTYKIGDNMDVELKIKNSGNEDKKFYIKTYIYDITRERSISEYENELEVGEGDTETSSFSINISEDVKEADKNAIFFRVYEKSNESYCNTNYYRINFERNTYDVAVNDIEITPSDLRCSDDVYAVVKLSNIGKGKVSNGYVKIEIPELGISSQSGVFDMDINDNAMKDFTFSIPESAKEGEYTLKAHWISNSVNSDYEEKISIGECKQETTGQEEINTIKLNELKEEQIIEGNNDLSSLFLLEGVILLCILITIIIIVIAIRRKKLMMRKMSKSISKSTSSSGKGKADERRDEKKKIRSVSIKEIRDKIREKSETLDTSGKRKVSRRKVNAKRARAKARKRKKR